MGTWQPNGSLSPLFSFLATINWKANTMKVKTSAQSFFIQIYKTGNMTRQIEEEREEPWQRQKGTITWAASKYKHIQTSNKENKNCLESVCLLMINLERTILDWHITFHGSIVLKIFFFFVKDLIHLSPTFREEDADTQSQQNFRLLCVFFFFVLFIFMGFFLSFNLSVSLSSLYFSRLCLLYILSVF